ncbi:MAG TPA: hypothetical protein VKB57_11555 [Acidimicrobiales bacterium]|nr:hypothetical protein [Acidimicrobiales bacterium]
MDGMSLLDVLRGVMLDPAEQAAYSADPSAYLERFGYDDVDPADLSEAFGLVADTLPPAQAQAAWAAAGTRPFGALGADDLGAHGDDAHDLDLHDLDHAGLSFGSGDPFSDHGHAGALDLDLDDDGADDGGDLDDGAGGLGLDVDGDGDPDGGLPDDASPFAHHGVFDHHDVFDHHTLGDDDPGADDHDAGTDDGGGHHELDDFDQLDGYSSLDDDGPDVGSF